MLAWILWVQMQGRDKEHYRLDLEKFGRVNPTTTTTTTATVAGVVTTYLLGYKRTHSASIDSSIIKEA